MTIIIVKTCAVGVYKKKIKITNPHTFSIMIKE